MHTIQVARIHGNVMGGISHSHQTSRENSREPHDVPADDQQDDHGGSHNGVAFFTAVKAGLRGTLTESQRTPAGIS
jgi:hypothetical protein